MVVTTLFKLAGFINDLRYVDITHQAPARMQPMLAQYPLGFGQRLQALAHDLSRPREFATTGDTDAIDGPALPRFVRRP